MPSPDKFIESLEKYEVDKKIITEINEGYEDIVSGASKPQKAAYFKRAVEIMENKLEPETTQEILEYNGCCKSGAREKASKAFAKEYANLPWQERLDKIVNVPNMGKPELNKDGTITLHAVYFHDGEKFNCACPNNNKVKRDYPVSKTYCFCCAGHFKYHYDIMLGVKLNVLEIVSSPLDSEGEKPCVMRLAVE